jgi:cytochrome d ubiquinol oxidase subunit II
MDLNTLWFILVGVLFTGYIMLDGFDLGVGMLHLFTKTDEHRRLMLNAIGPVWDGNEVWLVTGGGALFGAFPEVYATAFSAFYLPFTLLVIALLFRGVSIEFRSKRPSPTWRRFWDWSFAMGSFGSSFLLGVTVANILWGVPLDATHTYTGGLKDFLHSYGLWGGLLSVALFMMHGSLYTVMKTEGALQAQARGWVTYTMIFFIVAFLIFNLMSVSFVPHIAYCIETKPYLIYVAGLACVAILSLPYWVYHEREGLGFLVSCLTIGLLMALFGLTLFPNMIVSYPGIEHTLHIHNAASTNATLKIMAIMAAMGVPLVLTYTACIYWIFRGKVVLGPNSY